MKNLIFVMALLAIFSETRAQSGGKQLIWSIGVKPSLPFGHFSTYSGFGLGGNLQAEYKPGRWGVTLNGGYEDYFGKTTNGYEYADFQYIPVLAGAKYYMSPMAFLHGQVGPGFGLQGLGTSFWYGAGIGLKLGKTFDAELGYMGWKQNLVGNNNYTSNSSGTGGYGGNTGGTGGTGGAGGTGGGYGGHYPTIDVRVGINF